MNRIEAVAAVAAAAFLAVGCLLVLRPFVSAILWAAVLTFTTWPLLLKLQGWMKGRRTLAAFTMTALIALILVFPFVLAGITLTENVSRLEELFRALQGGLPVNAPEWVKQLPWVGRAIEHAWPGIAQDTGWLSTSVKSVGMKAGGWLLAHSIDFGKGVLQLILSVIIMFVFYRDGERVSARISAGAQRIAGDVSQRLLSIAGNTVRSVVYGIIGTALAQAIAAAIGFWVAGVPSSFLLGLLTFLLALIPGGPPCIWIPAAFWLFNAGHPGWGIFMIVWGIFIISGIDNLVRPYLISRGSNLPFIIVLLGAVGGVVAFGFIGLFLGPVLLAVGYALMREYTASRESTADELPPDLPV
ncbi:MAG: AI-2E family transporter [Kiritimatiellaceae bacterium]|nr:AI-2E family transporter [Kiritimatiellaceae bacterium]